MISAFIIALFTLSSFSSAAGIADGLLDKRDDSDDLTTTYIVYGQQTIYVDAVPATTSTVVPAPVSTTAVVPSAVPAVETSSAGIPPAITLATSQPPPAIVSPGSNYTQPPVEQSNSATSLSGFVTVTLATMIMALML